MCSNVATLYNGTYVELLSFLKKHLQTSTMKEWRLDTSLCPSNQNSGLYIIKSLSNALSDGSHISDESFVDNLKFNLLKTLSMSKGLSLSAVSQNIQRLTHVGYNVKHVFAGYTLHVRTKRRTSLIAKLGIHALCVENIFCFNAFLSRNG